MENMSADFQNAALLSWRLCGLPGLVQRHQQPELKEFSLCLPRFSHALRVSFPENTVGIRN